MPSPHPVVCILMTEEANAMLERLLHLLALNPMHSLTHSAGVLSRGVGKFAVFNQYHRFSQIWYSRGPKLLLITVTIVITNRKSRTWWNCCCEDLDDLERHTRRAKYLDGSSTCDCTAWLTATKLGMVAHLLNLRDGAPAPSKFLGPYTHIVWQSNQILNDAQTTWGVTSYRILHACQP